MRMQAVFCAIFKEQCVTRSYVKESIRLAVVDDAALTQPFLFTLDRVTSPLPLAHATPTHSSPHSPSASATLHVNAFLRSRGPSCSHCPVPIEQNPKHERSGSLVMRSGIISEAYNYNESTSRWTSQVLCPHKMGYN
jgi:hypothetical protein